MKYLIAFYFFLFKTILLIGQNNNASLHGTVLDSLGKTPLEFATFSIHDRDLKIIARGITNTTGFFEIKGIPLNDSIELVISFTGYLDFKKQLFLTQSGSTDIGNIRMIPDTKSLDTVLIKKQVPPVIMKKDTVEYNAGSFEARPNDVVEDLLKKLPGLEVDPSGNITFNGKKISRVLVDGREFFGNDALIATRNLPANMVSKIQVMDTKALEQLFNKRLTNGEDKTLNIKLKKIENNLFGSAHGGLGSGKRYELTGMLNYFNDKRKISVIGSSNNINQVGFTMGSSLGIVNPGNGITNSKLSGLNFNDEWGKKIKVNGSYFYDDATTSNESTVDRKQIVVTDSAFSTMSQNDQEDHGTGHRAQLTIAYAPDSANALNIVPNINTRNFYSDNKTQAYTTTQADEKLNESIRDLSTNGSSNNYLLQAFWGRMLNGKGRSFTISFNGAGGDQKNNSFNRSKNTYYKNNSIDSVQNINQQILADGKNFNFGFNISYNEPISEALHVILNENINVNHSNTNKLTYDLDSGGHIIRLDTIYSGSFQSNMTTNLSNLTMEFRKQKWDLSAGISIIYNQLVNNSNLPKNNLEQRQMNYAPVASILHHFGNGRTIWLYYSASTQQPTPDQLQPVPDNTNPLFIVTGNAALKPSFLQNYTLGYSTFSAGRNLDVGFQYNPSNNKIVNSIVYDNYGRQVSQFVNANGAYSMNGNISFTQSMKSENNTKNISLAFSTDYNRDIALVNNEKIISGTFNLAPRVGLGYYYKDILNVNFRYSFIYNLVQYNSSDQQQANYIVQSINNTITLTIFKTFRIESDLNYSSNSNAPIGFDRVSVLWNIGLAKSIFRNQKGQVKLFVFDLLKQNTNLHRTVSSNYVEDAQSNILQRYAMLSMTYNFNSFRNK